MIDVKRKGELLLNIVGFKNKPLMEWKGVFRNDEEIEYCLNDNEAIEKKHQTGRIEQIDKVLSNMLEGVDEVEVPTGPAPTVRGANTTVQPDDYSKTVIVDQKPIHRQVVSQVLKSSGPDTILTDKGMFYNIEHLRDNMIENLGVSKQQFLVACVEADIDLTTDFISDTSRKKLSKAIKVAIKSVSEDTGEGQDTLKEIMSLVGSMSTQLDKVSEGFTDLEGSVEEQYDRLKEVEESLANHPMTKITTLINQSPDRDRIGVDPLPKADTWIPEPVGEEDEPVSDDLDHPDVVEENEEGDNECS